MTTFSKGLRVTHNNIEGIIDFVCDEYVTFCIYTDSNDRSRSVCLLIYPCQYDEIKLIKESEK